MIPVSTRFDIISNRFAYTDDEIVQVNASQLCSEIIAHDKLKYKVAHLQSRIELLEVLLKERTYRYVDLRA